MSCPRCAIENNERTIALRGREDPPFPQARSFGTYGARLQPPDGFEPPRICLGCGVVYYPKMGEVVARSAPLRDPTPVGQCCADFCFERSIEGSDYCVGHQR